MELGVFGLNAYTTYRPDDTVRLTQLADELGYDSVWAGEHVVLPSPHVAPAPMQPTDPILDPLVHLAFVAAASPRLLLGTGIIILPQRNPLVLAKQIASLDVLSNGRLLLGLGAGYLEPEMSAIGAPMSERGRRTDDYIAAMRAVWTEPGPVTFDSPSASFAGIDAYPRPVQAGGPRVIIGGHTPAAYRRAVRSGHGWYGFGQNPEGTAACLAGLKEAADAVERPAGLGPLEITVTPRGRIDTAALEAFAAAGVDRLVINTAGAADANAVAERLQATAAAR